MRDEHGDPVRQLVGTELTAVRYAVERGEANRHIRTVLLGSPDSPPPAPNNETPDQTVQRLLNASAAHLVNSRERFHDSTQVIDPSTCEPVLRPGRGVHPELAAVMEEDLTAIQRFVARYTDDQPRDAGFSDLPDGDEDDPLGEAYEDAGALR
jgi:hypothetical protein